MGKKSKLNTKIKRKDLKPFVSICTPTFNRRPFFKQTINCYLNQDYPRDKLEWIIIDDGFDPIGDLVKDIPGVKYFLYPEKMSLGKKRNLMHEKSKGEILVYMDDDDYYPDCRVSHAVETLMKNPKALCAGSSEIYIWFKHIQSMYQFGPYGPNHATAGTFAMRRELLKISSYNEDAALAEEKGFLKDYSVPFVQLDPLKTILVFSHNHNTFDKKTLLANGESRVCKKSIKTVNMFIKNPDIRHFYMEEIETLLNEYDQGDPKHKPDVLKQTAEIKKKRASMEQEQRDKMLNQTILTMKTPDGKENALSINDVQRILNENQQTIIQKDVMIQRLMKENYELKIKLENTVTETETTRSTIVPTYTHNENTTEGAESIEVCEKTSDKGEWEEVTE